MSHSLSMSPKIRRRALSLGPFQVRVVHLWRDQWTVLSGPISGLGKGICCPLTKRKGNTLKVSSRFA